MEYIKIFIIFQLIFLLLQYINRFKLESYQYTELIFGSLFIIVFFGFFGSILTLDMMSPNPSVLQNSALIAILYSVWYYLTKKISNLINSDSNNVIYF